MYGEHQRGQTADVRGLAAGAPSAQDFNLAQWTDPIWTAPTDFATLSNPVGFVATDYERAILLAHAAGLQPARLSAQSNLVAQLAGLYQPNGAYGNPGLLNGTVFGLLALSRTNVPRSVLARGADVIRGAVHNDGGWTYGLATTPAQKAAPSDIDMTGAALAGLCSAGVAATDPIVTGGAGFLRGKLDSATGAFNAMFGKNADSNAWAVQGLNACGIDPQSAAWTTPAGKTPLDFLVSLQRTSGPNAGSFKYSPNESDGANPNLYASQDAVGALASAGFSADPPARSGGQPSVRPAPTVAAGTPVPTVLALDDGKGGVALCRTTAPAGAPLSAVLTAAKSASMPPGCVTDVMLDNGTVAAVNGTAPDSPSGGWLVSLDGRPETRAGAQPVGFGDVVALRLQHTPLPAGSLAASGGVDFGTQAQGTIGTARTVTFTASDVAIEPTRVSVDGDDFLVSGDTCTGVTVEPGATCAVRVRFAPAEPGGRTATLTVHSDALPATAALAGTGTVPQGAGQGAKGDTGASGAPGPAGATGPRGRDGKVTCTVTSKQRRNVSCTLSSKSPARLTRHGRLYARGTVGSLRATKRLPRGRYTLRTGSLRIAITLR